ncbi:MAG TPA: hypothetical protein VE977_09600, partial [Pyrinomonadaceae bacterium]|nr:hypothetical protein [Pyrinomonadaceae bacterium]
ILMALESGEVVAASIASHLGSMGHVQSLDLIGKKYEREYARRFNSRLRVSGLLRRAAFLPYLAEAAILFFGVNDRLRRKLARATRQANSAQSHVPIN